MASVSEASINGTPAGEQASGHPAAGVETQRALLWFAKRSALWLLIMTLGVGAACCLYAYAGDPEDLRAAKAAPTTTASIPKG